MERQEGKDDSALRLIRAMRKSLGNSFNKKTQFKEPSATILRILEEWELDTAATEFENISITPTPPSDNNIKPPRGRVVSKNMLEIVVEVPTDGEYVIRLPNIMSVKKFSIGEDQQGIVDLHNKELTFKCNLKAKGNWITLHI